MAWESLPSQQSKAAQNNTEAYFSAIALDPGELCHCRITADNNDATPGDDLEIKVYAAVEEAGNETWDTVPFMSFVLNAADAAQNVDQLISFTVSGVRTFRIGVASAGATDTWDIEFDYRLDGVNV